MNTARFIEYSSENLSHNLAVDHAIIKLLSENDYVFTLKLWQNPPSVVLGRGQDIYKEVNLEYCKSNNITVGRRISGGGAVYTDFGNYNISFYTPNKLISEFKELKDKRDFFTKILALSLVRSGFRDIEKSEYNILYKKKKISGSAGYVFKQNFLHQATLLTSTNLIHLERSLLVKEKQSNDRRASRYLPTINLPNFNLDKWKKELQNVVQDHFGFELIMSELNENEEKLTRNLEEELYTNRNWVYNAKRLTT